MSDTPYKRSILKALADRPSSLLLSHPSELNRGPHARAARAQDTVLGARRILASRHMGGSITWAVGNAAIDTVTQNYPDPDAWREIMRVRTEMMPGSVLVARAITAPSGATVTFDVGIGDWKQHGVQGQTRAVITWTNEAGATATQTCTIFPDAANDDLGAEDPGAGASWAQLKHHVIASIRPDGAGLTPAEAAKWSEWVTVDIVFEDRGGARIVHMTITEEPLEHTVADTVLESTLNGQRKTLDMETKFPQEEVVDGATFEEHRGGIHRAMYVATRQTARVGPRVLHFGVYTEGTAAVADLVHDPFLITSATPVRVVAGSNTSWDANAVGWDITQARRGPENLPSRVTGAASSPIRIRCYCSFDQAGANIGTLRIQSTARSFVELEIDQAVVGTTPQWVTITGWIETNIASDDWYAIVQEFAWTEGDTLQIWYGDVTYGDFAVGV